MFDRECFNFHMFQENGWQSTVSTIFHLLVNDNYWVVIYVLICSVVIVQIGVWKIHWLMLTSSVRTLKNFGQRAGPLCLLQFVFVCKCDNLSYHLCSQLFHGQSPQRMVKHLLVDAKMPNLYF